MIEIISCGDRTYRTANTEPVKLTDTQDTVLQAFLQQSPLDHRELVKAAGNGTRAPRTLKEIKDGYPQFAPAITMPGKKAAGGYRVKIRAEKPTA